MGGCFCSLFRGKQRLISSFPFYCTCFLRVTVNFNHLNPIIYYKLCCAMVLLIHYRQQTVKYHDPPFAPWNNKMTSIWVRKWDYHQFLKTLNFMTIYFNCNCLQINVLKQFFYKIVSTTYNYNLLV